MDKSGRDWIKWSEKEPYFGVLTDPKYLSDSLDENREAFWATGREYIDRALEDLEDHFGSLQKVRALDFGCGVGRLTLALAGHFEKVVGIDIAPAMVAEATRNALAAGLDNVVFVNSDALAFSQPQFDLVNSYIVLQHIPVVQGMSIIEMLLSSAVEGGVVSIHFSADRNDSFGQKLIYWAQCNIPGFGGLMNLARQRPFSQPQMQMNPYPVGAILERFVRFGYGPVLSSPEFHGRVLTFTLRARRLHVTGGG